MCTTVGFQYKEGMLLGRTLEIGVILDNKILYVPKNTKDFIKGNGVKYESKYSVLGSGFFNVPSFGDGINEMGLMGSNNFFPGYGSFSSEGIDGKVNTTTAEAFDFLLSRCKDVDEVKKEVKNINLLKNDKKEDKESASNHFFFMDSKGNKVVLEPKEGKLKEYNNPFGILTNSPEFSWHTTNLKNYVNLKAENINEKEFNEKIVTKFGEGTGMLGLPGDFTPPSRFIRAAYFVSNTPKNLKRNEGILQAFRILSQFDIPVGSVIDPKEKHEDITLYTSVMDTKEKGYFIKCHHNINIKKFYLDVFKNEKDIKFIELKKSMEL